MRVISPDGQQLGIMKVYEALKKAEELDLDLVEVAPNADPPVCRIMDFNKYKYEQKKKEREVKKHQRQSQLKEIRFKSRIDRHDLEIKINHAREFLEDGYKVKMTLVFRGRDLVHKEIGERLLDNVIESLSDVAQIDRDKRWEGKNLTVILSPGKKKGKREENKIELETEGEGDAKGKES